jgi:hypothetical protein
MIWKKLMGKVRLLLNLHANSSERFDRIAINQGRILTRMNEGLHSKSLADYEFSVFSQWGEDGIIQHLVDVVPIENRSFIEFGVENFFESNCRFLLQKDDWRGFVIDGSPKNIEELKRSYFYWKHDLNAVAAFVDADNINELLGQSGFPEKIGILSVDIDGNDYFVLQAISAFSPSILICEYNATFGPSDRVCIPYDPVFVRTKAHHSNLYWGASLAAMWELATRRGYTLVGTNSTGNNAFFVRNDLCSDRLAALTPEEAFVAPRFRESRDEKGQLTFLRSEERLDVIRGMPVFDVDSKEVRRYGARPIT